MFSGKNKNDDWEDSLLRATIIFHQKDSSRSRDALMLKAFYAIIVYSKDYSISNIKSLFKQRFGLTYTDSEVKQKLDSLKAEGLIDVSDDYSQISLIRDKQEVDFYTNLEKETDALFDHIINKLQSSRKTSFSNQERNGIKNNIKTALSIYFHHFGFAYVNLKRDAKESQISNAIKICENGLNKIDAEKLIGMLCSLIMNPTQDQRRILEQWARAYVTMEILNLDPSLRNFRATKLRDKTFVIDTDVVLHSLCTHAKYSNNFRTIIKQLSLTGCKFIIPTKVLKEVESHLQQAKIKYTAMGKAFDQFTEELLENDNVFIEDFIKRRRAVPEDADMPFSAYIANLFKNQSNRLLYTRIRAVLGKDFEEWNNDKLIELQTEEEKQLVNRIKEITEVSEKGSRRHDKYNLELANTDARIFLTIKSRNDNQKGTEDIAFSKYYYFMTMSRKVKTAALDIFQNLQSANCICHPNALLTILHQIGVINTELNYLNLFENPFLAYTAEKVKNEIKPLLDNNIDLKYADYITLREDADLQLNELITKDGKINETKIANLSERGYLFAKENTEKTLEIARLNKSLIEKEADNIKKGDRIRELESQTKRQNKKEEFIKNTQKKRIKNGRFLSNSKKRKK